MHKRPYAAIGARCLLIAIALGSVVLGYDICQIDTKTSEANRRLFEVREALKRTETGPELRGLRPVPPYYSSAQSAVAIAEYPLDAILATLEPISAPGVRLLQFEADSPARHARMTLQYQEDKTLAEYLAKLSTSTGEMTKWQLVQVTSDASTVVSGPGSTQAARPVAIPPPPPGIQGLPPLLAPASPAFLGTKSNSRWAILEWKM